MKYTLILLLLFILSFSFKDSVAQNLLVDHRIPHQVLGGVGGGLLGGAAGGLTGKLLTGDNPEGFEDIANVVLGVFVGYTVGNGLGVYYMGNTATEKGSLGWTLVGSTVGLVVGVGLGANMGEALLPVAATYVLVGSMAGYNLTRTSAVAFLSPATRSHTATNTIRTPLDIPQHHVSLVRIRF
jgi:uncharacterized protein YcfJ